MHVIYGRTLQRARTGTSLRAAQAVTGFTDTYVGQACCKCEEVLIDCLEEQFGCEPSDYELVEHANEFQAKHPLNGRHLLYD